MRRHLIHLLNAAVLGIILLGVPAITSRRFWDLQLSSVPKFQMLTLWGLALAGVGNLLAAGFLARKPKQRRPYWVWAAVFAVFWVAEFLHFQGYIRFDWLKNVLLELKRFF